MWPSPLPQPRLQQLLLLPPLLLLLLPAEVSASPSLAKNALRVYRELLEREKTECFGRLRRLDYLNGTSCRLFPANAVPGEEPNEKDIEFDTYRDNGVDLYSEVSVPLLIPYLVPGSDVAVVVAPGGGYVALDMNGEGTDVARWLNSIGVNVFLLKYRVPERMKLGFGGAPRIDAQRAMRLVRHRAADLKLDPSKIAFLGFSAGGHLSATTSTRYAEESYTHLDAADKVSSRPDLAFLIYPWELVNFWGRVQFDITAQTPPSFLIHAKNDKVSPVRNSVNYYKKLQKARVDSELHLFDDGVTEEDHVVIGHGYGVCEHPHIDKDKPICSWPSLAADFLHKHWQFGAKNVLV